MLLVWRAHDRIGRCMAIRLLECLRARRVLRKEGPAMIYAAFNIIGIVFGVWATLLVCMKEKL
jgi:hypothetical protein